MNILDLYRRATRHEAKKKTANEYAGPCPDCGGDDRFCMMLDQGKDGQGRYFCRGCERTGDRIQFLRDFQGMGFKEACRELGMETGRPTCPRTGHTPPNPPRSNAAGRNWTPKLNEPPGPKWQGHARKLIKWASAQLSKNGKVMDWLRTERGLDPETVKAARLGWIPADTYRDRRAWGLPQEMNKQGKPKKLWIPAGLVIPIFGLDGSILRVKFRRPEGTPKYIPLPTDPKNTSPLMVKTEAGPWAIMESELDALLLSQEAGHLVNAMALGSASYPPDSVAMSRLKDAPFVLLCLDYDEAGQKRTFQWWAEHFPEARPWPVPEGKDACEAWQNGWKISDWIKGGLPAGMCKAASQKRHQPSPQIQERTSKSIQPHRPSLAPLNEKSLATMPKYPHLAPCPLNGGAWVYRNKACSQCCQKETCPAWNGFSQNDQK